MDTINFRFLISFVVSQKLDMSLMNVETTYRSGLTLTHTYMKIPKLKDLFCLKCVRQPKNMFLINCKSSCLS